MQGRVAKHFHFSYGYFQGGAIGNILNIWEQAGIFSYAIPFLLIFALVFGMYPWLYHQYIDSLGLKNLFG